MAAGGGTHPPVGHSRCGGPHPPLVDRRRRPSWARGGDVPSAPARLTPGAEPDGEHGATDETGTTDGTGSTDGTGGTDGTRSGKTGLEVSDRDDAGLGEIGPEVSGRDGAGSEAAGRDGTGREGAGRDRTGRDGTGPSEVVLAWDEVPGRRERAGLALRERLPLWLQTRCGLERRHVAALALVFAVAAVFAVQHFWSGRTQAVRAPEVVRAAVPAPRHEDGNRASPASAPGAVPPGGAGTSPGPQIIVDVSGKVRHPGIHRLPAGSRVADALRAAGGVRPGTDLGGLNRARFLVDGEQVVVGGPAPASGPAAAGAAAGSTVTAGAAGAPAAPVSLNTATAEQLETLPGVGPVLARHIIDYRTQHGGFRSVEELRQVTGIGDRRYADLRGLVTS